MATSRDGGRDSEGMRRSSDWNGAAGKMWEKLLIRSLENIFLVYIGGKTYQQCSSRVSHGTVYSEEEI